MSIQLTRKKAGPMCMLAVQGHGTHEQGVIACAYAACVRIGDAKHWVWGYGGTKNTETFYVHGLASACQELFAHSEADQPSMAVYAYTVKFIENVIRLTPIWMANDGKNKLNETPDAYEEYKYLYGLLQLGKLGITKMTPGNSFQELPMAKELAGRLARKAHSSGAGLRCGIVACGSGVPEL
jgi:hypothetical protein